MSNPLDQNLPANSPRPSVVWVFLLPAIIMMIVFIYLPMVENVRNSLYQFGAIGSGRRWVGVNNYTELFYDKIFWKSFWNNIWYAVLSVIFQVYGSLVLAAMVESTIVRPRIGNLFRTVFFLPSLLTVTIVGTIWQFLYRPDIGLVNQVLERVGLESLTRVWLGDESTALFAVIGVSQWQFMGFTMLLFIVAIQAIPRELYEAATIDGAGGIQQFIHITRPGVQTTTLVLTVFTVVGSFKVFDIIRVMTSGGPNRSTEVVGSYLYRTAFRNNELGYASTIAVVLFVITFAIAALQIYARRKNSFSGPPK